MNNLFGSKAALVQNSFAPYGARAAFLYCPQVT